MPPYRSPSPGQAYKAKFIRIGERLYSTNPGDTGTPHDDLAHFDGVLGEILDLENTQSQALDAGLYGVYEDRSITITGFSSTLGLGRNEDARRISVTVFKRQSPGFKISSV